MVTKKQVLGSSLFQPPSPISSLLPEPNLTDKKKMVTNKKKYVVIALAISALIFYTAKALNIPPKFDGFVYQNLDQKTIIIEAFFDPVCPDSRDAWPPLKKALQHYGSRISLTVHPFPLPYHDNAFITSRALHVVNKLNASATYTMMEQFFRHQEKFYNAATHDKSRVAVVKSVINMMVKVLGESSLSAIESSINDRETDLTTRVSFKYGCSRGVYGTPFFYVNGFLLPDAGSAIDYKGWRDILDPLVAKEREGALHFFL